MPRVSTYNHFFPYRDGYYLAYNALTGAVGLMTAEHYATYQRLAEKLGTNGGEYTAPETELLNQLRHGRFVYDEATDQREGLKFRYRQARQDQSSLGLIIAPTLACNMACKYCFEGTKAGRMSPRVVESLLAFIERRSASLKDLQVTWYGGEPLLAMEIIEDISESVLDLARERKFTYSASMISNGYLLNRETVDRLAALRVTGVQVTLDGPSAIHNRKRPLKNGKESFAVIVENLRYAAEKMQVSIRVNVDRDASRDLARELAKELTAAGLRDKASIYFGMIEPATTACASISENCFEARSFSATEVTLMLELLTEGFRMEKLPGPILNFCFGQLVNGFLIDPEGEIYRCFNYVGDKTKSMGNITRDIDYQHPEFIRIYNFDPFEDSTCRDCSILPICMGACPSRRSDRTLAAEDYCDAWKFNLGPMLELIARSRQQQMAEQATSASSPTKESV